MPGRPRANVSLALFVLSFVKSVLRRGLGWSPYLAIGFAGRAISAVNMFLLMRKLSPEAFADFAYFQVGAAYIGGFALLGLDASSNVLSSRAGVSKQALNVVCYSSLALALASVLFVLPLLNVAFTASHSSPWLGAAAPLSLIAEAAFVLQGVTAGLLAGRALNLQVVTIAAIVAAGFFIFCIGAGSSGKAVIAGYVASQTIGVGLNVAVYWHAVGRELGFTQPQPKVMARLLGFGVRSASASLAMNMVQLSTQTRMLARQGTPTVENAKYAFAGQVYNILIFVPVILGPVVLNRIARKSDESDRRAACLRLAALFAVVSGLGLGLVLLGVKVVVLFLPSLYATAEYSVAVNAAAAFCGFVKSPLSIYFVASMRVLPDSVATIVASAVGLAVIATRGAADAEFASEVRLLVQGLQLLIVLWFFASDRRKSVNLVADVA